MMGLIDLSRPTMSSRSLWSSTCMRDKRNRCLAAVELEAGSGTIGERVCSSSEGS